MNRTRIGLFGASGYSGVEATRLLAEHPGVELAFAAADRWPGEKVAERTGAAALGALRYVSAEEGGALASRCEAVLLATPAEASLKWVPRLLDAGTRVVDLSGAFRLRDAKAYPRHYGFEHSSPQLLSLAVYGLPELFRKDIRSARLVANPGCYATAATLALAPWTRAGLVEDGSVVVDAASGVSGAGRKASEELSFMEVAEDYRAYRVLRHQHAPEVAQTLATWAGRPIPFTLTTHLLPVRRGILATASARLRGGADPAGLRVAWSDAYGAEPFIQLVAAPEDVSLKSVVGTHRCRLAMACDVDGTDPGRVVAVAALDNLLKGAAGQAIQNLNLMMGWEETAGLNGLGGRPS